MFVSIDEISNFLNIAIEAAILAGKKALEEISNVSANLKSPTELVTQADPLCQELIIHHIRNSFPGHGIIAEEGPRGSMLLESPTDDSDCWWIIDPIDGTNNYAHGLPCFCVSIGLIHHGRPIVGVIYDPSTNSLFSASQNTNTKLNGHDISTANESISVLSSFAVDSHIDVSIEKALYGIMKRTRFRCLGSTALHMAYVAKGAFIGAYTISARLWDIAAGIILVENAGGIVTSMTNKPLFPIDLYNYDGGKFHLLSTNKQIYPELLKVLETHV